MPYKAFVSSTFEDLKEHRRYVIEALRNAGIMVDPMENWTAATDEPKVFSQERVRGCDLCVLLVAFRRGYVPPGETVSITQLEYNAAIQSGIDVLVFLLKEESPWLRKFDELDKDPEIKKWRQELGTQKGVGFFGLEPNSIKIEPALTRWINQINSSKKDKAFILDAALEAHLNRIENEFVDHMSGMDKLTLSQVSARYIELLVQAAKDNNVKSVESTTEERIKPDQQKETAKPLINFIMKTGVRLAVYGAGGAGKTTSVLKLAFDFAQKAKLNTTTPIPLYTKLNFFSRPEGFEELVRVIALSNSLQEDEVLSMWRNTMRPIVFLMDGFNEVKNELQSSCALALEGLMQRRQHSYIITSRPISEIHELAGRCKLEELNIVELDDQQLENFLIQHEAGNLFKQMAPELIGLVRNPFLLWALAKSCAGLSTAQLPRNRGELYRNLIDDYLYGKLEKQKEPSPTEYNYELVKKPILASLALAMAREKTTRKIIDISLLRIISAQLKAISTDYEGLVNLEPYDLMPASYTAKDLLDEAVLNGILRKIGDTVEFMHQSVQDYFAAVGMLTWHENEVLNNAPPVSFAKNGYNSTDRFDAIVMLTGLKDDPTLLLKALVKHNPLLAAYCFFSASNVSGACRNELCSYWESLLQWQNKSYRILACTCMGVAKINDEKVQQKLIEIALYDDEYRARESAKYALQQVKSGYTIYSLISLALKDDSDDDLCKDISSLLHDIDLSEAVTILFKEWKNSKENKTKHRKVEILLTPNSWNRKDISSILSKIRLHAVQREDIQTDQDSKKVQDNLSLWEEKYKKNILRIPHASELGKTKTQYADLTDDVLLYEEGKDDEPLGRLEEKVAHKIYEETINWVGDLGKQNTKSAELGKALSKMKVIDVLKTLKRDDYVAGLAAKELGKRKVKKAVIPLVEMLYKLSIKKKNVEMAVTALKNIDEAKTIHYLQARLQDNDKIRQTRAAIVLGLFGHYENIDLIIQALKEEDLAFRSAAAKVLGNLGTEDAEKAIVEMISLEDKEEVFAELVHALGQMKSKSSMDVLLKLLLEEAMAIHYSSGNGEETLKQTIRKISIQRFGDKKLFSLLKEAALDSNAFIRRNALRELISLTNGQRDISDILNQAWTDPDAGTRAISLEGMAKNVKSHSELLNLLQAPLKDQNEHVRSAAIGIYPEAESEETRSKLLEIGLSDPSEYIRNTAISKLRKSLDWAVDQLTSILKQDASEKRLAAINAFRTLGSYATFRSEGYVLSDTAKEKLFLPLSEMLKDPDHEIRLKVLQVINRIFHKEKHELIISELVYLAWHGKTSEIRQDAAELLESKDQGFQTLYKPIFDHLGDKKDYPALLKIIGEDQPFLPKNGYVYVLRGLLYHSLNKFEQALADFKMAEDLNYKNGWLWQNYADVYDKLERYEEARFACQKWLEFESDDADAHGNLGWYYFKLGKYKKAIEESKLAFNLDPTKAMAAFNLGLAYLADLQFDNARITYEQALAVCKQVDEEQCKAILQAAINDLNDLVLVSPELQTAADEIKSQIFAIQILDAEDK